LKALASRSIAGALGRKHAEALFCADFAALDERFMRNAPIFLAPAGSLTDATDGGAGEVSLKPGERPIRFNDLPITSWRTGTLVCLDGIWSDAITGWLLVRRQLRKGAFNEDQTGNGSNVCRPVLTRRNRGK
jgi:hypothetical protein